VGNLGYYTTKGICTVHIIIIVKTKRLGWARNVDRDKNNTYIILATKSREKKTT